LDVIRQLHPKAYDDYPRITHFLEQMAGLPGIKEYLAKRRGSDFLLFKSRYPDTEE